MKFLVLACLLLSRQAFCINPQTPQGGLLFNTDLKSPLGDFGVKSTIKIGLLIQDNNSVEARNGAEMAIAEANKNGGFNGREFELIVKSMEGPWGTGSKQAVDMIFQDEVVAIVGSHDGRNAHLVEQVTTKAHIAFLSAWAGDPTLSQAFTPWFFNSVPNSDQQAVILVQELKNKKFSNMMIVVDDDYDASTTFKSYIRKSEESNFPKAQTIVLDRSERVFSELSEMLNKADFQCLLLFTTPVAANKIICKLKEAGISVPVYGPLSLLGESSPLYNNPEVLKNLLLLSSGDWFLKEKSDFATGFHDLFGSYPGAQAAYAYDAMSVMINSVKSAGEDKNIIHKVLMNTGYKGITGAIKFDERGNRIANAGMAE